MASTGNVQNVNRNSEWVIDSAATSHASGNLSLFATLTYGKYGEAKVANNSFVKVLGKGTVQIKLVNKAGKVSLGTMTEVLYAPGISENLLEN